MTLSGEIQRLQTNLASSYTACEGKGATLPTDQNFDNLAECIGSIEDPVTVDSALSTTSENPVENRVITGALNGKQTTANLVTSVSSSSTDAQYPSAKCVYDIAGDIDSVLDEIIIGGSGIGITREISAQGVYQIPASSFTFSLPSNATDLGDYAMYYAFQSCRGLTSVDLSSLSQISNFQAMCGAFHACYYVTSVDLSNLITVSGNVALQEAFYQCTDLTTIDLSSLTTISGIRAFENAFYQCFDLTSVDLSSLTTVSGDRAMYWIFQGCTGLTSVDLSSLAILSGQYAMQWAFQNCTSLTSLSFPSLNSNSFGSYTNQFNGMLGSVTGCTVHFPSNLQSVIGSWSDVTAGFGGTNTTVLFDLPATT